MGVLDPTHKNLRGTGRRTGSVKNTLASQTQRNPAMRVPRMTTRRWMMAVALVGMAFGVGVMSHRVMEQARTYRALATRYATSEQNALRAGAYSAGMVPRMKKQLEGVEKGSLLESHLKRAHKDFVVDVAWKQRQ